MEQSFVVSKADISQTSQTKFPSFVRKIAHYRVHKTSVTFPYPVKLIHSKAFQLIY